MKAKASGLLKMLRSRPLILFMHFLHDILATFGDLSRDLQRQDASLYECHQKIDTTKSMITKYASKPGFHLKKVIDEDTFNGESLHGNKKEFEHASETTVRKLVDALEGRFDDMSQGVLSATRIADLKTWPSSFDEGTLNIYK